ncbi:CoA-binding protein, partial [Candidatus Micrarchaeota archaeon]|nr:CoA-binding protein [Candidatus Micrarchaeota archaeon]MBU1939182.1 CoA-binding protein [Candidatus Micrarchaeota archaeon]
MDKRRKRGGGIEMRKDMKLMDYFFSPKSVAIIGASPQERSIGKAIAENFIGGEFKGAIYPVNPKHKTLFGKRCYASVKAIPRAVDAAVIAVPAKFVPQVVRECGEASVKAVTIISAGFNEVGNAKLTAQLQGVLDKYKNKMRVIGPNCLGTLDTKSGVDMLFLPRSRLGRPGKGVVSFISQSGALGSAILDWDAMKGYGINKFVSYGNAMDVDEADLVEYLAQDKSTDVVVVYIEGVRDGKKFFRVAKKMGNKKPIIAIKGGLTEGGAKAAHSHTGSLAGAAEVYSAVFTQANIVHAKTMEEVFDFARVFSTEPAPRGKRVQIITDGGGYGVLGTDALLDNGMKMAKISAKTRKFIEKNSPDYAVIRNPIDLTGDADNKRYEMAISA